MSCSGETGGAKAEVLMKTGNLDSEMQGLKGEGSRGVRKRKHRGCHVETVDQLTGCLLRVT